MKKLLLVFIVLILLFGCTPKDNNIDPDSSNQTVTYQENVVIYPPTDNNDTIISVSLAQKVQAEVAGYIVNDGKWELIFKAMSIDLNPTDYIAIKNNYSKYNTIYIGIGANGPFDINASGQVSYKQVQHNLSLVTSTGAKVTSTHQFYEDMNKNHPHKGLFYILDNYKFEIDKEQTIGFQIISDYGINQEFLSQLNYVTLDDLSKLPDTNQYNPYQLVMITLNFKLVE
ncbi:MAG: hypothetical protein SPK49_05100 [Erysipelotrichaceae bacterium]|nr:hypothetical protein [Erysipelotrichaceae bacterium]